MRPRRLSPSFGAGPQRLAEERGLKVAAAGSHPISRPEDAGDRRRDRVRGVRRIRRRVGAAPGRERAPRPRRHAERRRVLPRARRRAARGSRSCSPLSANSPYLAGEETGMQSNRAEVLAQLPAAALRPRSRSYEDWEEFVERFAQARDRRRLHALLVGHPPAPALRDARDPHARPADRARANGRARDLLVELCRAVLDRPQPRVRSGGARPLPAEPLGRGALRARGGALPSRTASARRRPSELAAELAGDRLDTSTTEAERQLEVGRADGLEAVCADLVERTLG